MTGLVTGDEFEQRIRACRRLVFRLETLQEYRGSGEDEWIDAFTAGATQPPPEPAQDEWEDMIRGMTAAGTLFQRVHVVLEPLTDYMRFELAWAYPPNVAAGEDVRIIDASDGWPVDVPRHDFWILDGEVYDGVYDPDGTWHGVRRQRVPAVLAASKRARWAAVAQSMPLERYLARHPDVAARVAAG